MADYDVYKEIRFLRDRVQAIDHKQEVLIRAQRAAIETEVLSAMRADPKLARVYVNVDGKRTQKEIVDVLGATGKAMSQPTVSRRMDVLSGELAVIELVDRTRLGDVYAKSAVDRILRLTPKVERLLREVGP